MQEKLGVKHEAATCYVNAAKMMKKTDAKGSIVPLEKAATRFAELSRFNFASKYSIEIGEILENDVVSARLVLTPPRGPLPPSGAVVSDVLAVGRGGKCAPSCERGPRWAQGPGQPPGTRGAWLAAFWCLCGF